jgi:hypothetical protein
MLEVLEFILSDTSFFFKTIVLIFVTGQAIADIIDAIKGNRGKNNENTD